MCWDNYLRKALSIIINFYPYSDRMALLKLKLTSLFQYHSNIHSNSRIKGQCDQDFYGNLEECLMLKEYVFKPHEKYEINKIIGDFNSKHGK